MIVIGRQRGPRLRGAVDVASADSFPASDAPARGPMTGVGAPARAPQVLHPTDYSGPSRAAFELAGLLARGWAGRLTLMHAAAPPPASLGLVAGPALPAGYRGAWESQLSLLRPRAPALPVDYLIEEGDPADAILRAAHRTGCDLIVMGARRRAGWGWLRRGVTGRVARRAPCPVLTLMPRPGADWECGAREEALAPGPILHATDFSAPARCAFAVASALARAAGRELLVVHVVPGRLWRRSGHRRQADELLGRLTSSARGVRARGLVLPGDAAAQTICAADQLGCGLIVTGTRGGTWLQRLLTGSVARSVQRGAPCAVLTAQLPAEGTGAAKRSDE